MNSPANLAVAESASVRPYASFPGSPDETFAPRFEETVPNHAAVSLTFNAPLARVYDQWQNYAGFPYFMRRDVGEEDNGRITWRVSVQGRESAWDAEVVEEVSQERITWQSTSGRPCRNSGSVSFEAVGDKRTRVTLAIEFELPPVAGESDPLRTLTSRLQQALVSFGKFAEAPEN
jgi:uncharacterized membrane protein